jgi:CRISPR/Cas system-associated exonuclease Cas4 (RecB family)
MNDTATIVPPVVQAPPARVNKPKSLEELLTTVSASRLNTFHSCRLKFYFNYVAGIPRAKSGAQHIGSTVHFTLKLWNLARWRKQSIPDGWLRQQFDLFWKEDQEDQIRWEPGEEDESKAKAWALLNTYFSQSPIPPNEPAEGVEVSVEADLGTTKLVGIIDLVRSGGRIVEFKTTGQTPNPEKAEHIHELQCSCYAVMYREATGQTESAVELHHLVKLKTPKLVVTALPAMTSKQEIRLLKTVDSYLEGVQRQDWVPSPSPVTCSCCEFFNQCRQWS